MGSSSAPSIPKPPNFGKSYGQGIDTFLKYLPQLIGAEDQYRTSEDPKRIEEQQALQDKYGPKQYQQMLDALNQLDPTYQKTRNDLGNSVDSELKAGRSLTPEQQQAVSGYVRSSQAARGSLYGGAQATAEGYALGDRGEQMFQQRVKNAGNFLSLPTMAQVAGGVPPVSPDRSYGYVNPNAGYQGAQFALQNYQNQLGAASLQASQQSSPWGTIGTILQGVGSIAGIAGMFSDRRAKTDIKKVGKDSATGLDRYRFKYRSPTFEGVMADDVEKIAPGAVSIDPASGFKKVNYAALGTNMRRVS